MKPKVDQLSRPIAFVFSGGASLGALQIGQVRALLEVGVTPDLVVGTSVGAINAAYLAADFSMRGLENLEKIWLGIRSDQIFGSLGVGTVMRLLRGASHLSSPEGLLRVLGNLETDFQELSIPTFVVSVDYLTGMVVVLSEGNLRKAVLASAAIPHVFPAVDVDGQTLVDGGISSNVPILQAVQAGAKTLFVLDAGYPCALKSSPVGLTQQVLHTMSLALRYQILNVLPEIQSKHAIAYLPAPCPLRIGPHDFSKSQELIQIGYTLAREFLDTNQVPTTGIVGYPHIHL
jgi:NTE family protein